MSDVSEQQVVLALFGHDDVDVVVAITPPNFPSSLVPPAPVRVLGGATTEGAVIVVFRYPTDVHDSVATYAEFARTSGWTDSDWAIGTAFGPRESLIMLEQHDTALTVRKGPRATDGSTVVVTRGRVGGSPRPHKRGHRPDFGEIVLPRMTAFPDANFVGGGGSSGGGDHITQNERLITSANPSVILDHYAQQLSRHGWTLGESWNASAGSVQWMSAPDARGREWVGKLSVFSIGQSVELFVNMSLVQNNVS